MYFIRSGSQVKMQLASDSSVGFLAVLWAILTEEGAGARIVLVDAACGVLNNSQETQTTENNAISW